MSNLGNIISFLLITLFWGGSFLGIGIAVKDFPPFFAAFLRVFIAFLLITGYLLWKRGRIERPVIWKQAMASGLCAMGIPWIFLFWGEKHVAPAIAAILNGTVPIFTVLLAPLLTPQERQNRTQWLGVALGFAGVLLIFLPQIGENSILELKGMFALLLMAFFYGISILWTRRISGRITATVNLHYQSLSACIFLLIASLIWEVPHQHFVWSIRAFLAIAYLGVFSTTIAWILFFRLLKNVGSVQASATTYCVPLIALTLDFFFWDKWIHLYQGIGAMIILLSVFLVHQRR